MKKNIRNKRRNFDLMNYFCNYSFGPSTTIKVLYGALTSKTETFQTVG